jgi:hypothetical protein
MKRGFGVGGYLIAQKLNFKLRGWKMAAEVWYARAFCGGAALWCVRAVRGAGKFG